MDLARLDTPEARSFVREHEKDDVQQIVLSSARWPDLPIKEIAHQIQSRRKAKRKLPEWYEQERVLFPAPHFLEQASSQASASFKASFFKGDSLLDLTGGTGVDAYYLSGNFREATVVEPQPDLFWFLQHNFKALGRENVSVFNLTAEDFLEDHQQTFDTIYLDPSRRDEGERVFQLEDCQPDLLKILPKLLERTQQVVVKCSPLLDIELALRQLKQVSRVWVFGILNECKELLFEIKEEAEEPVFEAVNLTKDGVQEFSFRRSEEAGADITFSDPRDFLYEPNTAVLKSGAFKLVAGRFGLKKLHVNSHLYTASVLKEEFPGRIFKVSEWHKFSWKLLQQWSGKKANIVSRNFPHSVAEIRNRTKIKEGGEDFLFFTRSTNDQLIFVSSKKIMTEG